MERFIRETYLEEIDGIRCDRLDKEAGEKTFLSLYMYVVETFGQ